MAAALSASIVVPSHVTLIGSGADSLVISDGDGAPTMRLHRGGRIYHIALRNRQHHPTLEVSILLMQWGIDECSTDAMGDR